jgi:hypothetical protein
VGNRPFRNSRDCSRHWRELTNAPGRRLFLYYLPEDLFGIKITDGSAEKKAGCISPAALTADLRLDLKHGVGTILGGDPNELLAVGVAALYFIKTAL